MATCKLVIVLRGPPFMRCFIAMCAAGLLLSSLATGVGQKRLDVVVDGHAGPVLGEDAPAEGVDLDELDGFDPSGPCGGKAEPSDP